VVTVLSNADAPALRLMISREPKGLSLIGPIRRHIHQTRYAEAARERSVDRRLHDVWSEEGERKSHAGRPFADGFAGRDRLNAFDLARKSFRRAIAALSQWRLGAFFSLQPGSASPRSPIRSTAGLSRACEGVRATMGL
jgi:hypothetical protein